MGNNGSKKGQPTRHRIAIEGLYGAGKTTILRKLQETEEGPDRPNIGVAAMDQTETLRLKDFAVSAMDVGGRCSMRPLRHQFWQQSSAVVFVVDASERGKMEHSKWQLKLVVKHEYTQDAIFVILANKQDIAGAADVPEVIDLLDLHDVKQQCNVFGTCATTGEGVFEALDWLKNALEEKEGKTIEPDTEHDAVKEKKGKESSKGLSGYLRKLPGSLKNAFMA